MLIINLKNLNLNTCQAFCIFNFIKTVTILNVSLNIIDNVKIKIIYNSLS
jgi:hypothetical protein